MVDDHVDHVMRGVATSGGRVLYFMCINGYDGLALRSQLQGWRVPGSEPDLTENPLCIWAWCTLNLTSSVKRPPTGVVRKFGEGIARSGVVLVI
ncbi:hypothetical protein AVEN_115687-1 [Araneus ventricosus]|uniref:Uncharacterized protein n=1 Tax=Araneus ventricosus TaxID=182803 RepID=A0A4Y2RCY1_ARAVE|nr:hypothetical protein AVEN_56506-1 [Araneus ventricosus]GBN73270.1 hypothetical protein AVEN_115687-1 [Araneus ventricosus]